MKKYKLVDRDGYTRRGGTGETYWLDGKEKIAHGAGNKLCTDDVIHYYDHPLLAVLFNPIHANIETPRLIEIEIDKEWAHDGLKGGCKKARYLKEITLPEITIEQRVAFAIKISLKYYKDEYFVLWAENWLNGKDRTRESAAEAAARAARAARAAWAAWEAVDAEAASAAARAARAARAAWEAEAAEAAARAARAAWTTVSAEWAARAASAAARAERNKVNKLFIKTIMEII